MSWVLRSLMRASIAARDLMTFSCSIRRFAPLIELRCLRFVLCSLCCLSDGLRCSQRSSLLRPVGSLGGHVDRRRKRTLCAPCPTTRDGRKPSIYGIASS